jgi:hypothetical protein
MTENGQPWPLDRLIHYSGEDLADWLDGHGARAVARLLRDPASRMTQLWRSSEDEQRGELLRMMLRTRLP